MKFYADMNEILELTFSANNNKNMVPILEEKQKKVIDFLCIQVIAPFLKNNSGYSVDLMSLFESFSNNRVEDKLNEFKISK